VEILPAFRVAAIQAASVLFEADACINKACELIERAASEGARLIVFPEGFLPGHPIWLDYYTATDKTALSFYRKLFSSAVEIPGPGIKRICETAKTAGTIVVLGVCERRPKTTGTLYNSQVFIDHQGEILGVRRKLVPTLKERIVHSPGFGAMVQVYESRLGRIGGLICGENSNALAKFALMSQGELIHAASWPPYFSKKKMADIIGYATRALAYENKTFVINAAGAVDKSNLKAIGINAEDLSENVLALAGGSSVIAPSGEMIAGPLPAGEDILFCEINLSDIILEKMFHDFAGHYNRSDVFSLHVNNQVREGILELDYAGDIDSIEAEGEKDEKGYK